jgi:hypothetical protein
MEYDEWLTLPTFQWGIVGSKWSREGVLWYKKGEKRIHNLAADGVGTASGSPIRRIITDLGHQASDLIDGEPRSYMQE